METQTVFDTQTVIDAWEPDATPDADGLYYLADIRFRMLQPRELAAAHSFSADYQFCGTRADIVKQVGNSWPVETGAAICNEILQGAAA